MTTGSNSIDQDAPSLSVYARSITLQTAEINRLLEASTTKLHNDRLDYLVLMKKMESTNEALLIQLDRQTNFSNSMDKLLQKIQRQDETVRALMAGQVQMTDTLETVIKILRTLQGTIQEKHEEHYLRPQQHVQEPFTQDENVEKNIVDDGRQLENMKDGQENNEVVQNVQTAATLPRFARSEPKKAVTRKLLSSSDYGSDEEELKMKAFHARLKCGGNLEDTREHQEVLVKKKQRKVPRLAGKWTQEQWAEDEDEDEVIMSDDTEL